MNGNARKLLFIVLLIPTIHFLQAQPALIPADSFPEVHPPSIFLIAKAYQDSVVLRWAPREPAFWKAANHSGYIVRRYLVEGNKPPQNLSAVQLNAHPLLPWALEEWKEKSNPNDTLAAMAAQILHGGTTQTTRTGDPGMEEMLNAKIEADNKHGYALVLADQSAFVANGLALRFVDKSYDKGKNYVYTVHALTDPAIYKSDTAAVFIDTKDLNPLPAFPPVTVEQLDKAVKFSWDRETAGLFYSAYVFERSEDNGKTFKKSSGQPYIQPVSKDQAYDNPPIVLVDSLPENYKKYTYRIYGISPFGEQGPYSANLPVMGKDLTPPSPPQDVIAENVKDHEVKITWAKNFQEDDFSGFLIGRSQNVDGPYTPLNLKPLPKNATEFIDKEAIPHGTNYYVVAAIDTATNAGLSIPAYVIMIDETPPAKPVGLTGKIDTTGIVTLNWEIGMEEDLLGYLVYYANAPDHAFTPLTEGFIADNTFIDSIGFNNLTRHIYYKIIAYDKNRNPSAFSDVLELKKPDFIPPVQAVFDNYIVSDTSIYFTWAPSSSNDLASQILLRKENEGDWAELASLQKETAQYTDRKVKRNTNYEYSIISVDESGLKSPMSFPLNLKLIDSGVRENIRSFTAQALPDSMAVKLNWQYLVEDDVQFILYRSYNDNGLLIYKSIDAETTTFVDEDLQEGEYAYAIKAVYTDGGESPLVKSGILKLDLK